MQLCPCITSLDLSENRVVTDQGVRAVAENLHSLSGINLSVCARLTDVSVEHLTQYNALTLKILHLNDLSTVHVDVLVALLQKCTCLHTIELDCDLEPYYADIIPHMCNLRTLITYSRLSDNAICLIAAKCRKLQQLAIFSNHTTHTTAFNRDARIMRCVLQLVNFKTCSYSEKGLLALLDGLPLLQVLGVQEKEREHCLLQRRSVRVVAFGVDTECFAFDCLSE